MKKKNIKIIIAIVIVIIAIIVGTCLMSLISRNVVIEKTEKNSKNINAASYIPNQLEEIEEIKMDYNVIAKVGDGYNTKLTFTAGKCIKEVQILNINKRVENPNKDDKRKMEVEFNAQRGIKYNIKVIMASELEEEKILSIDEFLDNNKAPSIPIITTWPEENTIKVGRNITITANSVDPEQNEITYEWVGRTSETASYPVGSHTVKVRAIDIYGAASDWATYTFNVINVQAADVSYEINGSKGTNFNILGNGTQTTYNNIGYSTVFRVNETDTSIRGGVGSSNGINFNTKIEPLWDGNYLKISYTIKNADTTPKTIGIATHADIMINKDDTATITDMNGRGFTMTDGTYNYKVFLRSMENVVDVDTYWFGRYSDRMKNLWSNSNINELRGIDSGMAFSWKDRTIKPEETQVYSFIIGLE